MAETSSSHWYHVKGAKYMQHWRNVSINVTKEPGTTLVFPEVDDWIQRVPYEGEDNFECTEWQYVRLSHNGNQSKGWVPDWLISRGCIDPPLVVVPPAIEALAAQPQPEMWKPQMDVLREKAARYFDNFVQNEETPTSSILPCISTACDVLSKKAAQYFDTFDQPGETHTSLLLPHIKFPTPTLIGPLTVENFQHIDPAEWAAFDISTFADMTEHDGDRMEDHWTQNENMSAMRLYHGTVMGAVFGIISAGGFVPGEGKCRKNSRARKGAFCTTDFAQAFEKGTGHTLDYAEDAPDGNKKLNMMCMPVVVELHALDWRPPPTHMHGNKYCFEEPSLLCKGVLPGVIITKLYINKVLVENFNRHKHFYPERADPYKVRVCGQNAQTFQTEMYQATCGRILLASDSFYQSNTNIWYCHACFKFRVQEGPYVYSLPKKQ